MTARTANTAVSVNAALAADDGGRGARSHLREAVKRRRIQLMDWCQRARFRSFIKFCLLWANHNPPGSSSEADLLTLVDHWIAQYFRQPEYLTLDGKPTRNR